MKSAREIEIKLVVQSADPEVTAGEVERLDALAGYRLAARPPVPIHDVYLEIGDRELARCGVALRLRQAGAACSIALKGAARINAWGALERLEIETQWSEQALEEILRELAARGARVPAVVPAGAHRTPRATMEALGFAGFQERKTRRRPRDLSRPEDNPAAAELVIDTVSYRFGAETVRHHEVEIEQRQPEGGDAVRAAAEELQARFGCVLRSWRWGKLSTGAAIEKLLRRGALQAHLGPGGGLGPPAYDLIERCLGTESAPDLVD